MNTFEDYSFEIFLALIAALVVALLVYFVVRDTSRWNEFKEKHHCKVVSHQTGELFNTFNSNGSVGIGTTSDKIGWLCDDGITYIR